MTVQQVNSIPPINPNPNQSQPEQIREQTIYKRQNSEQVNEILYLYNRHGQLISSQVHEIDVLV